MGQSERDPKVNRKQGNEPERWSQGPENGHGLFRSVTVPVIVVAAIIGSIWYIESGRSIPFLEDLSPRTGDVPAGTTFVSFESQDIDLGAPDGPPPEIGKLAPDFALSDLDGELLRLSDLRGKTVVLNAWATWCTPCRKEFPELVNLYEANKDSGLVVVGLNLREAPVNVRRFAEDFGAKYPIVIDKDGSVIARYRLLGLPTTWFIDADGVLRSQHIGLLTPEILIANLGVAGFTVARYP